MPIIFLTPFLITHAQSGKVVQTPQPTVTPIPQVMLSTQPDTKSNFVVDGKGDKYKLVFETSYEGKLGGYLPREKVEMMQARRSGLKNFSEQLNEAGKQGYKVVSALPTYLVAVMALDETQYEYELFETISSVHFAKSELQNKLEKMSETGFQLVEHSQLFPSCEWIDPENLYMGENCEYTDRFLVEKESEIKKPIEQILVNTFPGWGAKPSAELEKQIDEKLAEGFYPTKIFSKFEILLEKAKDKEELLSDKPDVKIVRSSWGRGNLDKKVNELAKQGYRLAMTNNGIAVMYRNKETAQTPVSYIWVKADKKNFEKNLAKLREKGAIYRTAYPNEKGTENTLIFEQKLKDDGKRSEFKVLKFEFDSKENMEEKKVYIDLTPSSKEAVKTLNKLTREGFEVRDLFYADEVSVILERER